MPETADINPGHAAAPGNQLLLAFKDKNHGLLSVQYEHPVSQKCLDKEPISSSQL